MVLAIVNALTTTPVIAVHTVPALPVIVVNVAAVRAAGTTTRATRAAAGTTMIVVVVVMVIMMILRESSSAHQKSRHSGDSESFADEVHNFSYSWDALSSTKLSQSSKTSTPDTNSLKRQSVAGGDTMPCGLCSADEEVGGDSLPLRTRRKGPA